MKQVFDTTENAETENGQLVATAPRDLSLPKSLPQHEGLEGDFDMSDLQHPKFQLVGKTSKLVSKTVPAGSFVLNKTLVVGDGETPVLVSPLAMTKEYWQKMPEGSTERPAVFKNIRDVREFGGSVEYGSPDIPFQNAARVLALVRSERELPYFIYQDDGKFHALVLWFIAGTAYTSAAKQFVTDFVNRPKGAPTKFYEVTSSIQSNAKGSWYLPNVRLTKDEVSENLLNQVKALLT
ncbi:MAG: hypothetical protein ABI162_06955 [Luteolibacter sp.]